MHACIQYAGAAADDAAGRPPLRFYQSTIVSRLLLAAAFAALVLSRQSPAGLALLAAINLLGAAGMALALRRRGPLFSYTHSTCTCTCWD